MSQPNAVSPGLTRQRVDDDTVSVYTFYDNRRETIDAWYEKLHELHYSWDASQPYLILHDVSRVFLTPYFRKRANDVMALDRTDLIGAYAVLLPDSIVGHIMRLFLNRDLQSTSHQTTGVSFNQYDDALNWLREKRREFATIS
jgi:hypothetical protein